MGCFFHAIQMFRFELIKHFQQRILHNAHCMWCLTHSVRDAFSCNDCVGNVLGHCRTPL